MDLKPECQALGEGIIDIYDGLARARAFTGKRDFDTARHLVHTVARDLEDPRIFPGLPTNLAQALADAINACEKETVDASLVIGKLQDKVFDILLERVVECECGKRG